MHLVLREALVEEAPRGPGRVEVHLKLFQRQGQPAVAGRVGVLVGEEVGLVRERETVVEVVPGLDVVRLDASVVVEPAVQRRVAIGPRDQVSDPLEVKHVEHLRGARLGGLVPVAIVSHQRARHCAGRRARKAAAPSVWSAVIFNTLSASRSSRRPVSWSTSVQVSAPPWPSRAPAGRTLPARRRGRGAPASDPPSAVTSVAELDGPGLVRAERAGQHHQLLGPAEADVTNQA